MLGPKLEEEDITKKAFELLFAFDEVINLGYRDSMTLEQVCLNAITLSKG